jgi:hypothetical protein
MIADLLHVRVPLSTRGGRLPWSTNRMPRSTDTSLGKTVKGANIQHPVRRAQRAQQRRTLLHTPISARGPWLACLVNGLLPPAQLRTAALTRPCEGRAEANLLPLVHMATPACCCHQRQLLKAVQRPAAWRL